jgi:hypothetical protein
MVGKQGRTKAQGLMQMRAARHAVYGGYWRKLEEAVVAGIYWSMAINPKKQCKSVGRRLR